MANISNVYVELMDKTNLIAGADQAIQNWNSNERWSPDSLTSYASPRRADSFTVRRMKSIT